MVSDVLQEGGTLAGRAREVAALSVGEQRLWILEVLPSADANARRERERSDWLASIGSATKTTDGGFR